MRAPPSILKMIASHHSDVRGRPNRWWLGQSRMWNVMKRETYQAIYRLITQFESVWAGLYTLANSICRVNSFCFICFLSHFWNSFEWYARFILHVGGHIFKDISSYAPFHCFMKPSRSVKNLFQMWKICFILWNESSFVAPICAEKPFETFWRFCSAFCEKSVPNVKNLFHSVERKQLVAPICAEKPFGTFWRFCSARFISVLSSFIYFLPSVGWHILTGVWYMACGLGSSRTQQYAMNWKAIILAVWLWHMENMSVGFLTKHSDMDY